MLFPPHQQLLIKRWLWPLLKILPSDPECLLHIISEWSFQVIWFAGDQPPSVWLINKQALTCWRNFSTHRASSLLHLSSCGSCLFLDIARAYFSLYRVVVVVALHPCKIPWNSHILEEFWFSWHHPFHHHPHSVAGQERLVTLEPDTPRFSTPISISYLLPWRPQARYFNP